MQPRDLLLAALLLAGASPIAAQGRTQPFAIADNSFLVEEAFNQEKGIFQNILLFQRPNAGGWQMEFTQEWPVGGQTHQFSYTVPFADGGIGDLMLNWRVQARQEDATGPAISPRLSVILPTGKDDSYQAGVQFNLPVSRQFGDLYVHANGGGTLDRVELGETHSLISPHAAVGLIYRAWPMVHVMAESVLRNEQTVSGLGKERETVLLVSPGVRAGFNLGSHQLVLGAAAPLTVAGPAGDAFLVYLSYELPFTRNR